MKALKESLESVTKASVEAVVRRILGSLSNDDDDGNENVISKYNFSFL